MDGVCLWCVCAVFGCGVWCVRGVVCGVWCVFVCDMCVCVKHQIFLFIYLWLIILLLVVGQLFLLCKLLAAGKGQVADFGNPGAESPKLSLCMLHHAWGQYMEQCTNV